MNLIQQWFANLKKPEERFIPSDYHKAELKKVEEGRSFLGDREWSKNYHTKELEKTYPESIEILKKVAIRALTERKTATQQDFEAQLKKVLEANSALAHQKLLGVNEKSEMTQILATNYREAIAKLRFLVYEDINIPDDAAEALIQKYVEQEAEAPADGR